MFVGAALVSCSDTRVWKELCGIESYIVTRPDSALVELRSIDTLSFSAKKERALYSLLSAMAYDKNYIDTANIDVIGPAVEYYRRHLDRERLMKSFYYQGIIYANGGDWESASRSFLQARELTQYSEDERFKGLVSAGLSRMYSHSHNAADELFYAKESQEHFINAGDDYNVWFMDGYIATAYANTQDWEKSDSLFSRFRSQDIKDTLQYARFLMNAAKTKILLPEPRPEECISLVEESLNLGWRPTVENICVYAYAFELSGKVAEADKLMGVVGKVPSEGSNFGVVNLWRYKIFRHRKDYKGALFGLENSTVAQDSLLISLLGQSLEKAQKDYYAEKSLRLSAENRSRSLQLWLVLLASVIIIASILVFYYRLKNKWMRQLDEVESMRNDLARLTSENDVRSKELSGLRQEYSSLFKEQFELLDDLCAAYWSPSLSSRKERVFSASKHAIESINDGKQLEARIDKHLDGIMSKLRQDLPRHGEKGYKIMALMILGFSGKTIASMMDFSVGSVYTYKNRIRHEVNALNSPNRDFFLQYLA